MATLEPVDPHGSESTKCIHDPEIRQPPLQLPFQPRWHKRGRKRSFLRHHHGDRHVLRAWSSTSGHSHTRVSTNAEWNKGNNGGSHISHGNSYWFLPFYREAQHSAESRQLRLTQSHNAMLSRPIPITGQVVSVHFLHSVLSTFSQVFFFGFRNKSRNFSEAKPKVFGVYIQGWTWTGNRFLFTSFGRLIFPFATNNL